MVLYLYQEVRREPQKGEIEMTKYLVSFFNAKDVWLETVTVESCFSNIDYIKMLAKKQSKYYIGRNCSVKVYKDGEGII